VHSDLTAAEQRALIRRIERGDHLPLDFYADPATTVARRLLGKGLVISMPRRPPLIVALTEVEAYLGAADPAAHTYRGMTERNKTMFRGGGHCYVYFSYGMHHCMNVVTGKPGDGVAVLLRSAAPVLGVDALAANRGLALDGRQRTLRNILSGPGKLTQALGIDLAHDGRLFTEPDLRLVELGPDLSRTRIERSPRIGISKAVDEPLRFSIKDSEWLSR
jgi:DNA-3-methyladenine glycosylase